MKPLTLKDEYGASVVEVMVATIVFMVIMTGGLHYYLVPQATFARKKINRLAISAAQQRLETLIASGYNGVSPDSNEADASVTIGPRNGTRNTTVVTVDDPLDGIGGADADGDSVDYKVITVQIAWNDGREQNISLSTVVSDVSSGGSSGGSSSGGGAFTGSAWGRKCELVIQADKVDENLTGFPLLLTENTLPAEMFDSDGLYPALNGGGDVRFSSDESGLIRLACDIVTLTTASDPANGAAEIWVNVPSVSGSSNTSIWVWYNKAGESQPGRDEAYGSEAVWNNGYALVQHLNQNPASSAPQFTDATSGNHDGSNNGGLIASDLTDGVIANGLEFDGSLDDDIDLGIWDVTGNQLTVQHWVYVFPNPGADGDLFSRAQGTAESQHWLTTEIESNGILPRLRLKTLNWTTSVQGSAMAPDSWYLFAATYDGLFMRIWAKNEPSTITASAFKIGSISTSTTIHNYLGDNEGGSRQFEGRMDEVRVSTVRRSDNWLLAEYNNQLHPQTFVIAGTPQSP